MKLKVSGKSNEIMDVMHPWPNELPLLCPKCDTEFDTRINISYDRFGYLQTIRKMAMWVPLPALPIALYFGFTLRGNGAMMAIAAMTITPSILLNLFYAMHRPKRRLKCFKCDYEYFDKVSKFKKRGTGIRNDV